MTPIDRASHIHHPVRRLPAGVEEALSAFGEHLLRHRLTDDRHARFFVYWVRRFLGTPPPFPDATAKDVLRAYRFGKPGSFVELSAG